MTYGLHSHRCSLTLAWTGDASNEQASVHGSDAADGEPGCTHSLGAPKGMAGSRQCTEARAREWGQHQGVGRLDGGRQTQWEGCATTMRCSGWYVPEAVQSAHMPGTARNPTSRGELGKEQRHKGPPTRMWQIGSLRCTRHRHDHQVH